MQWLLLAFVGVGGQLCTPAAAVGQTALPHGGERALAEYLASCRTQVAYHAVRLADGRILASRDAARPMVPASVQKLCTSAIALASLGADFSFKTTLAVCGGDLVVLGDGDPALGDPVLAAEQNVSIYDVPDRWAVKLKAEGISAVRGNLVLDDDIFHARRHPDWPEREHQRWYCAAVSGLNFNDNCLDIRIYRQDGALRVDVSPASRHISVVNRLAAGTRQVWVVTYTEDDATVTLIGQVRTSMTRPLSVAVNKPSLLFGRVLADRLALAGIQLEGGIVRRRVLGPDRMLPDEVTVVATHTTALSTVLSRANKQSLNMMAECLLLRAAADGRGSATFSQAAEFGTGVLVRDYGVDPSQFVLADGSGMSRRNRLSALAAVDLLRRLAGRADSETFRQSLAVAGVDGTMAKRLKQFSGRVLAKTGSLAGTSALAGYILDGRGEPVVAFAIFCNNIRGPNSQAKKVQDALVGDWVADVDELER
ncbi:MAG: D-alanyl-D-alanine carboxypeptidase/D-alanyl-D-alanine-endopeptidase [Planctomycetes bacterium]|nr:D-alanyl-D-alanine carboxypeptidase/D-alanyl-D-alanine-endopeptidase [Planctomycetota bacterium]